MAERTGLEPGVTGRYSNQLNYRSALSLPPFNVTTRAHYKDAPDHVNAFDH